jgi:tRNA/rRNA methyltransferase
VVFGDVRFPALVAVLTLEPETPFPRRCLRPLRPWYSGPTMVGAGTNRSRPRIGGGPAVILVRPQLAVNIGMCARAMANFGLDDLRLVNPRQGWPRTDEYHEVAYSAAAGASDLLDSARVFASVEAAVGDLHVVYAATARERGQMKAVLSPSVAMGATAAAVSEKRGILFGPERTGLDNDEVAIANSIVTFPSSPAYASLNLSQAVLICGYEWFKAAHGDAPPPPTVPRPQSPPAQREMLLAFFDFLEGKLEENGFFRPVTKKPGMRRNLRNMLHRMEPTQQDVRTLWGAVVRLVEGPRVEVQTRKRVRQKKADASP